MEFVGTFQPGINILHVLINKGYNLVTYTFEGIKITQYVQTNTKFQQFTKICPMNFNDSTVIVS